MKMKTWKRCVCMIGVALFAVTNLNAQTKMNDNPVKKTRSTTFICEKDKAWEPAGEGVTRQIMGYDGQVMLVKVKFEKGAVGTSHTHYHTQTTYVASGKFEFTVGNEKKIVKAGDGIYIEPDILHGCVCLEAGVLIDCFAPMRADFLK
ncbi:cupin domain-containing protein [Bacteroides sp. AN502(2024)]|uniref:cupin domain-containing protein n=1 Tax=Bacteroides sp. AN502(2024) TaxID=3160599 RepID=UPI003517C23B